MPIAPKLVILDRDGVINQDSDEYIKSPDEWVPYPQAIAAIGQLCRAGWTVTVATNQSGIARGYYGESSLAKMHERLHQLVAATGGAISTIAYCPHGPDDQCSCRKPKPGLLLEIQQRLGLESLHDAWLVGDSLRDLQAGNAVGCRVALVRTGKGLETEKREGEALEGVPVFDDLAAFTVWLLSTSTVE